MSAVNANTTAQKNLPRTPSPALDPKNIFAPLTAGSHLNEGYVMTSDFVHLVSAITVRNCPLLCPTLVTPPYSSAMSTNIGGPIIPGESQPPPRLVLPTGRPEPKDRGEYPPIFGDDNRPIMPQLPVPVQKPGRGQTSDPHYARLPEGTVVSSKVKRETNWATVAGGVGGAIVAGALIVWCVGNDVVPAGAVDDANIAPAWDRFLMGMQMAWQAF